MGRRPGLKMVRGAWSAMEDEILTNYISIHGEGNWRSLSIDAGLKRCGKSCRLRWMNYLKPGIKRGNITEDEEDMIIRLHKLLGNRWSLIAGRLPGRTDNEIKNYWNANVRKRLQDGNPTREHHFQDQNKLQTLSASIRPYEDQPKPLSPSCVVRPKATRCTKVIISEEHQNIQQKRIADNTQIKAFNVIEDSMCSVGMIDMDCPILSNISEIDEYLPFFDTEPLHYNGQQNGGESLVSPFWNDSILFHEDMQGELDMDWIPRF